MALMLSAKGRLVGAGLAGDLLPVLEGRRVHHAGPPIAFEQMSSPMRGALVAAVLLERWATRSEEAETLLASGAVETAANNDHSTVGPMAGPVSASTPMWVVEDMGSGRRVFAPFHEGFGKAQSMGAYGSDTISRIRTTASVVVPVVEAGLQALGGIDLNHFVAEAIERGDELHNRCKAATSMLMNYIVYGALQAGVDTQRVTSAYKHLSANSQTAATPVMAWAKLACSLAEAVPGSSLVTTYARNGTTVGLKISGCGERWFIDEAPMVDGNYLHGYGPEDATPDLGDSAIVEVGGVGAFVMAAAPAFAKVVGESTAQSADHTLEMYKITHGENRSLRIPALEWRGAPVGIDAVKVIETGITPIHNTAIAHKAAGIGIVGTGMVRGSMRCYRAAIEALEVS